MKHHKEMTRETFFSKCTQGLIISSSFGVLLSLYSLYVEYNAEDDENYEALCDINDHVSCTKVFTSEYGRGFGLIEPIFGEDSILNIPNAFMGLIVYGIIGALSLSNHIKFSKSQVILSAISNLISLYLFYILLFVLEDLCVVCVTMYLINFINLILSAQRYNYLKEQKIQQQFKIMNRDNNDSKID